MQAPQMDMIALDKTEKRFTKGLQFSKAMDKGVAEVQSKVFGLKSSGSKAVFYAACVPAPLAILVLSFPLWVSVPLNVNTTSPPCQSCED